MPGWGVLIGLSASENRKVGVSTPPLATTSSLEERFFLDQGLSYRFKKLPNWNVGSGSRSSVGRTIRSRILIRFTVS